MPIRFLLTVLLRKVLGNLGRKGHSGFRASVAFQVNAQDAALETSDWCEVAARYPSPFLTVALLLVKSAGFYILVHCLLWIMKQVEIRLGNSGGVVTDMLAGSHKMTACLAVVCFVIAELGEIVSLLYGRYAQLACIFQPTGA